MKRICSSLAENGYQVTLIGRRLAASKPLQQESYRQVRLRCWFTKGKAFYAEYNARLFIYLVYKKADAICAIDLDTIMPCLVISKWKKWKRIYDAHELFTELKEVISRPGILKFWRNIEKKTVPQFKNGYTVSESISEEFNKRYGVKYETIRNMPVLTDIPKSTVKKRFILYQGAVNEARGFEQLIPAMKQINVPLVICGDGNFMKKLKALVVEQGVEEKVILKGLVTPQELGDISNEAAIGIGIAEKEGLNQYLALPNKFFDYMHAGLPQVSMNYPEYQKINQEYEVALLINDTKPETIANAVNKLMLDAVLYEKLRSNCLAAREVYNWQQEEKKLLAFYKKIFSS
jgi:glycosyltransferase involved in cell wall biosynthesis